MGGGDLLRFSGPEKAMCAGSAMRGKSTSMAGGRGHGWSAMRSMARSIKRGKTVKTGFFIHFFIQIRHVTHFYRKNRSVGRWRGLWRAKVSLSGWLPGIFQAPGVSELPEALPEEYSAYRFFGQIRTAIGESSATREIPGT